jgi:dipeptidyl aminopeptidase/acylaminoacyl peptidase
MAISGGSAGGYTTLACLAFKDVFAAGASHYGIGNLEALAQDTHKFESRYLDRLVGEYPKDLSVYQQRSPIQSVETFKCPLIQFQGLDDKVVPPNQAEEVFHALLKKGVKTAAIMFEKEQHGFRRANNIRRALDSELEFYGKIFDFQPILPEDHIKIKMGEKVVVAVEVEKKETTGTAATTAMSSTL